MSKRRSLFLYMDPLVDTEEDFGISRLSSSLKDIQSKGYFTIGLFHRVKDVPNNLSGLNVLHVVVSPDKWNFPEYAWSSAIRHSINIKASLLCSSEPKHIEWVRSAGLSRLEDPYYLLGV